PPPRSTLFPYTTLFRSRLAHFRARRPRKVMHHKLIGTLVLIDDGCLPGKKIRGHPLRVALPFELPSRVDNAIAWRKLGPIVQSRSEEHTSELQSRFDLV